MKRMMTILVAGMMALLFNAAAASAELTVRGVDSLGNQLIYDSALNVTWYDYSHAQSSWQSQVNWASGLTVNFNGQNITGWTLPTTTQGTGWNITSGQLGYLYYTELHRSANVYDPSKVGPFQHLVPGANAGMYWYGTPDASSPQYYAFYQDFYMGGQWSNTKTGVGSNLYAIAVHAGDVASPVPIPAAAYLLASGLLGLMGVRKKILA